MKTTRPQPVNREGIAELLFHVCTLAKTVDEYRCRLRSLPPVITGEEHDELDRMGFMIALIAEAMDPFGCAVRTEDEIDDYRAEVKACDAALSTSLNATGNQQNSGTLERCHRRIRRCLNWFPTNRILPSVAECF